MVARLLINLANLRGQYHTQSGLVLPVVES